LLQHRHPLIVRIHQFLRVLQGQPDNVLEPAAFAASAMFLSEHGSVTLGRALTALPRMVR
jgi:hypothetical protein